jgi:hypothetical protein
MEILLFYMLVLGDQELLRVRRQSESMEVLALHLHEERRQRAPGKQGGRCESLAL